MPKPTFEAATPDALVAYAYLAASVKFQLPFFEFRKPRDFAESAGQKTLVSCFGIRPEDEYAYYKLRRQVEVLYTKEDEQRPSVIPAQFILDLCRTSQPCEILLACIPAEKDLATTIARLDAKRSRARLDDYEKEIGPSEVVLVPNMLFELSHHFAELEGKDKTLANPGFERFWISEALQTIRFRLDRSGAELASEAKNICCPKPRYFIFERPFLILMRKRGALEPFFVMWVDNAELLCKP